MYVGYFKFGKPWGFGKFIVLNKNEFYGNFKNG